MDFRQYRKSPARLHQLDALRGVAVLFVLLYHLTLRFSEKYDPTLPFPHFLSLGSYGVHLFFMISGYVIFMSLDQKSSMRTFLPHRIFRLYPTFWICSLVTYLMLLWCPLPNWNVSGTEALINASMLSLTLGAEYIDGVYWSLEVEIYFYLLLFLLFALKMRSFIFVLFALAVTVQGLAELHAISLSYLYRLPFIKPHILLSYLHLFLFGMICFEQRVRPSRWQNPALILCLISTFLYKPLEYAFVVNVLGVIFWSATRNEIRVLQAKVLLFLGYISYPLYLLHQNISHIILWEGMKYSIAWYLRYPIAVFLVVVCAYIVSRYVENPVNRFLREGYNRIAS